ncbi:hypothetical protein HYALB_00007308 [Hymenoscyphus albidus]|uniref:Uncharacterized protein n=1 Tax=Hymenoscyphus albidus TaxID=595503 RepID=A0A9N9QCN4_9HELO|nr:hypothetical protein HYALB_00007308 [Hymenoscyphus albidus]
MASYRWDDTVHWSFRASLESGLRSAGMRMMKAIYYNLNQRVFTPGRTKYAADGLVTLSPIDGFEVRPGELVIDCRTVRRHNTVEVANLAGRRGRVRADNLQLIENPWRFNDYEPKHDPPRSTPLTLNKTTMHFMNSQSDPRLIEGWLKLCDKQADEAVEWRGLVMRIVILNERLPLVRMKEGKAGTRINIGTDQEQPGWAAVEQGELVRIHAHANNYNTIFRAIDIEGRATRIRDRNIEHFARKFPFGVAKARDNCGLENVAGKEYRDVARMFKKIMRQMTDAETGFSKKRALKEA